MTAIEMLLALWPAQVFLFALALTAIGFVAILAFLWAWLGLAYHLAFFASINPLAYAFSAISVVGALFSSGKASSAADSSSD